MHNFITSSIVFTNKKGRDRFNPPPIKISTLVAKNTSRTVRGNKIIRSVYDSYLHPQLLPFNITTMRGINISTEIVNLISSRCLLTSNLILFGLGIPHCVYYSPLRPLILGAFPVMGLIRGEHYAYLIID